MVHDFVRQFSDIKINAVRISSSYYHCSEKIAKVKNNIKVKPYAAGLFLGSKVNGQFVPSVGLLDILAKNSDKKVFVNKKGEWLFLCGRDLFGNSVVKSENFEKDSLVLVQNENDENLGYGSVVDYINNPKNKNKMVVKNLLDRGSFLRREKNKS